MIQRTPFRHFGTDADVARLAKLLHDAFNAAGFFPSGPLSVLNLACGRADESGALAQALLPAPIGFYLGIDLRPETIAEAQKRWHLPDGEISFLTGDASATHRMRELPPMDLVFIRHQNYWNDPKTWDRLLENALLSLKPTGLLACTSYFDVEHDLMIAALKTRGATIKVNLRNHASRPLKDAPGKSVDRRLALFSTLASNMT